MAHVNREMYNSVGVRFKVDLIRAIPVEVKFDDIIILTEKNYKDYQLKNCLKKGKRITNKNENV